MDMGGGGVVAGVMRALALRGAKANVVGLGRAGREHARPECAAPRRRGEVDEGRHDRGDQYRAEGRLVLADVMWYAQDRFKPAGNDRPCHR